MAQIILTIIVVIGVGVMLYRAHLADKADKANAAARKPKRRERDPNDTRDWPAIVAKATELADLQAKPCVALHLGDDPNTDAPHSCIGGRPSLPVGMDWPADETGKPMIFLAQINFAEMPPLAGYPDRGLLSFFVMDDDLNGSQFPSVGDKGFQVHFFDDPDTLVRAPFPEVTWEFVPMSDLLVQEGRPLTGATATGPLSANSYQVSELTRDWYPNCPNDLWDAFGDRLVQTKPSPFYFGGHPDFVQQDIRHPGGNPDYTAYSEVLFQMGYLHSKDRKIEVCWGDAGEACFLITKDDLAARRFDRVIYSWDCG